jgi:hypothetical protein
MKENRTWPGTAQVALSGQEMRIEELIRLP